jgi:hypothetical protein
LYAPVDDEINRALVDPEEVEEGGPLRRCAVRSDPRALAFQLAEQRNELVLESGDPRREVFVELERRNVLRLFRKHRLNTRVSRACAGLREEDADRATVDREAFDVMNLEAVASCELVESREREIAKVLVVNRVELAVLDEVAHVRAFDDRDSTAVEHRRKTGNDTIQVGHVREDIVRVNDVGAKPLRRELVGELIAEEANDGSNPLLLRDLCDVLCRFDPEDRNAASLVVLQEVTVVAGDLGREAVWAKRERLDEARGERFGMLQHRLRKRREVEVLTKHRLWRNFLRDLDERARLAKHEIERKPRLQSRELLLRQKRIREGRGPEREHGP